MKASTEQRKQWRDEFYQKVEEQEIDLIEALKMMRKILNKSQADFAKLIGVSKKLISEFELGKREPRLDTLRKLYAPMGMDIGLRPKRK